MKYTKRLEILEKILDESSIYELLKDVATVCHKKSMDDHHEPSSELWTQYGMAIDLTVYHIEKIQEKFK